MLLDDDEDDEDVKSTVNPTKPNTKKFNAGVVKRYVILLLITHLRNMCILNPIILFLYKNGVMLSVLFNR